MASAGSDATEVHGHVDSRFEPVREAFRANFAPADDDPGELGAGLAVYASGLPVVRLWGGFRDSAQAEPWTEDTLVNVYSIGKGVTALAALTLVEQRRIDLDAPITEAWADFSGPTTLREIMAHRAGLPGFRRPMPPEVVYDWDAVVAELAREEPWWPPGTAHGYHVNTFGHLVGEPCRRVAGVERFGILIDELARRAAADVFLGLPSSQHSRVATVVGSVAEATPPSWPDALDPTEAADQAALLAHCAYFNPAAMSGIGVVNTPAWRQTEVPSTNMHASAEGVARLYASVLGLGGVGRDRPFGRAVLAEAVEEQSFGPDCVLGRPSRFGLGFILHTDDRPIGISPASFGHFGHGGSLGFADPDAEIAVGYVMNRPGDRWQAPRVKRILAALRGCL